MAEVVVGTLPPFPSPQTTLDAVRAALQQRAAQEPIRDYLGASQLGHVCDRNLWYAANGYEQSERHPNAVTGAADGYACEPVLTERLKMLPGLEVITHQPNGLQYEFSDFGGKFKGHPDGFVLGLLEAPATWHVLEYKSKKQEEFNKLWKLIQQDQKSALFHWDFNYWVQAQIYMHYFELTRHFLICCTPGAREMISCRTDYDRAAARRMIARTKRILETETLPNRAFNDPNRLECKWCNYKDHCWG